MERRPITWHCTCSQERVEATLCSLGEVELRAMADEDDGATVNCHFCCDSYTVDADRLRSLADQVVAESDAD